MRPAKRPLNCELFAILGNQMDSPVTVLKFKKYINIHGNINGYQLFKHILIAE